MRSFLQKIQSASVALRSIALLMLVAFLLSGCTQTVTPVARVDAEDTRVEEIVAKVDAGVEPADLYEQVYTTKRVVSVILEGFTSEENMRALADIASGYDVPVVFFISYVDASDYPDAAKYIANQSCELGNYGLDGEKAMQNNTTEQNAKAFSKTQYAIQIAAERTPSLFRCNGSEYTDELLSIAAASGLQAGVEPSSYLNHRSFSSYGNALNYVRKLQRGSVISIKLGQELDDDEYGDPGSELDERPAIDKEPTLTDENLFSDDDTYSNTLNVFKWLLDALQEEQFDVVSLKSLERSKQQDTKVHSLSESELALYNGDNYTLPLTDESLGATLTDAVTDSYFDGAVFIGDSISLRLQTYVEAQREIDPDFFGTARFLTSQGLGVGNALWQISSDSRHPTYNGAVMSVEDAVAAMGDVTRIYIMLGMNDIQYYDAEEFINNYRTLIYLIQDKMPGVDICVQSITPGTAGRSSVPTNEDIFLYDLALAKLCTEYGYTYIDVASALRDDTGALPETLCSDSSNLGLHLNESAVEIWIHYLRTHAVSTAD